MVSTGRTKTQLLTYSDEDGLGPMTKHTSSSVLHQNPAFAEDIKNATAAELEFDSHHQNNKPKLTDGTNKHNKAFDGNSESQYTYLASSTANIDHTDSNKNKGGQKKKFSLFNSICCAVGTSHRFSEKQTKKKQEMKA